MSRAIVGAFVLLGVTTAATLAQQPRGVQAVDAALGRRVALVIGNDAYVTVPLRNAVNDAKAVAVALKKYGFQVEPAFDTSLKDLNKAIDRFVSGLHAGDVAMVYYAGHGMQIENENYLVPVDFTTQEEADVKYEAYSASRVADRLAGSGARLSILVLDACRSNPFRSSRAATRGLAPMETGKGSLIAFATGPNRTADDNPTGQNGLFTSYLLQAMDEPGLSIEQVFSRARTRVNEASNGRQTPWLVSSVIGDFYFRPPAATPATPDSEETKLWQSISESESPDDFKTYLAKYPNGTYARLATLYIKALELQGAGRKDTGGAPPGALNETAPRAAAAGATRWQPYFMRARDAKTYVPFVVPLDRVTATQKLAMYYRVARADAPSGAASGPGKPAYEDYREVEVTGGGTDGQYVQAAFAVPAGDYVVSIALAPLDTSTPQKDRVAGLIRRVDRGDPDLVRQRLVVPNFWDGKLATSSIVLAREVKPASGQATPIEQANHPFSVGGMAIVPARSPRFSRSEDLQVVLFVYNPGRRAETNKPDVKADYAFYVQAARSERFFNRTTSLGLNASTLPAAFDLDAGHQIAAGQAVPLASFAPGDYRLQVTVTDNVRNETVTSSVTFTVY